MKLLLDTCTFLWACGEPARLSVRARDLLRAPGHDVYLSAASAWEIAAKYALGRLDLDESPERVVPWMREAHGIEALPVDEESVLQTVRLPLLHRDPFDRLLVCQAIVHGMTLVTPDELIAQYPARVLW
jgi:PIN domain nuclease of toxin-antitoxin system